MRDVEHVSQQENGKTNRESERLKSRDEHEEEAGDRYCNQRQEGQCFCGMKIDKVCICARMQARQACQHPSFLSFFVPLP